jgi:hypothetical protein
MDHGTSGDGGLTEGYAAAMAARVTAYRRRKAEQNAEIEAARTAALDDAAAYMARMVVGDAAHK